MSNYLWFCLAFFCRASLATTPATSVLPYPALPLRERIDNSWGSLRRLSMSSISVSRPHTRLHGLLGINTPRWVISRLAIALFIYQCDRYFHLHFYNVILITYTPTSIPIYRRRIECIPNKLVLVVIGQLLMRF